MRSALTILRSTRSPPLRASRYMLMQPATEPAVAMTAYSSQRDGCCVTIQISSRSGTCGSDSSDESSSATRKRPGRPEGQRERLDGGDDFRHAVGV